jgi:hypothetical protein
VLLETKSPNPQAPLTPDEAKKFLRTGVWDDDPALRMVVQDAARAESYEKSKQWVNGWTVASTLYQSPYGTRNWEGTQVERANVPFYTLATAVNGLVPQIMNGLFYESPPFMVQQRPKTTAQAARAWSALLAFQLEDINFREECRLGIHQAALYGTGIWKWGWESYTRKRKLYVRPNQPIQIPDPTGNPNASPITIESDDIEIEPVEEQIDRPFFEHIVNLGRVMVDPGLDKPDIRKAKYVVERMYMTFDDLDKLRDRPGFTIPPKEKLIMLFFPPREEPEQDTGSVETAMGTAVQQAKPAYETTTIDPFNEPLEVLERWDNDKYIVVLQKKLVICNTENPYGVIPYLSVNWWDVPEAFHGMGLGKLIGSEQRLQQGITNVWLDQAALNLNGVFVRVRGKNVPTQSIRIAPGKIIEVDEPNGFAPLPRTPAVPEAGAHISMSQGRVDLVSGAGDAGTSGVAGASGHSNLARTAAGASLLSAGSSNRTGDFVEKFSTQVFLPFVFRAMEMDKALLPVSSIRDILNDELEHEYLASGGTVIDLLNAQVRFSISAGAKMQARRAMAQSLPIITQFLSQPSVTQQLMVAGKKVNMQEVLRMFFETSEWRNYYDVIVDMTPEELQRSQADSPAAAAAAKAQAMQQLQDHSFDRKEELADQENMARAAREVLRHAIEASAGPITLTGEPGGSGAGSAL